MTARLLTFSYQSRGSTGWCSPVLEFGSALTVVGGDNGSGKTPIMKGIMSALGHQVSLDPEILRNCSSARVTLAIDGANITLTRNLGERFSIEVSDGSRTTTHESEAEFSTWMLDALGVPQRSLTSLRKDETQVYLNVFYPLFWVDQDIGWASLYAPPTGRNFIQSQYTEMVRLALGLSARHPFRSRDEYDRSKERLEAIEKHLETQRLLLERLNSNAEIDVRDKTALEQRRNQLKAELASFETTLENVRSLAQRHDEVIARLEGQRSALLNHRTSLEGRQGQLELALNEIDGEVEVLAANVQATDLLKDFCGNAACKMFQPHSESYGRTLLFLKDQMKDLKSADGTLAKEVSRTSSRIEAIDVELQKARHARELVVNASPHAQVHAQIAAIAKNLLEVEVRITKIEQIAGERKRLEKTLEDREKQIRLVESLRPKGGQRRDDGSVIDARIHLARRMDEWLETLSTPNLPRGVAVDEDFELIIRGEVFSRDSSISGSTRTRVVLAFHAALMEAALDREGNHPGWLLLDAPKQHELSQSDLNAYIGRLSDVARRHPGKVQTVFSIANTEAPIPLRSGDVSWMPTYGSGRNAKYLWPAEKLRSV